MSYPLNTLQFSSDFESASYTFFRVNTGLFWLVNWSDIPPTSGIFSAPCIVVELRRLYQASYHVDKFSMTDSERDSTSLNVTVLKSIFWIAGCGEFFFILSMTCDNNTLLPECTGPVMMENCGSFFKMVSMVSSSFDLLKNVLGTFLLVFEEIVL